MRKINDTLKGVIRVIVAIVAFVNAILTSKGMSPLPIDETMTTEALSDIAAGALILYAAYKDLPITKEGKMGHEHTRSLKAEKKEFKKAIREDGYGVTPYGDDLDDDDLDGYEDEWDDDDYIEDRELHPRDPFEPSDDWDEEGEGHVE